MLNRLFMLLVFYRAAPAQDLEQVAEQTRRLVAMVDARWAAAPDQRSDAAAVIVAHRDKVLYLITCKHAVRHGSDEMPSEDASVKLGFRWLPGREVTARVTKSSAELDLALLEADAADLRITPDTLLFTALPRNSKIEKDTPVWLIGKPNGKTWDRQVEPDWVSNADDALWVVFRSDFLAAGHSGGAVANENWELLGLIRDEAPPTGRALRIGKALDQVRGWGKPVDLSEGFLDAVPKFTTVSSAKGFACGLTVTGRAYCWSNAGSHNTAHPEAGRLRFKTISVGYAHTCAVTLGGAGYCWGANWDGQLGIGRKEREFDDPMPVQGGHSWREMFSGVRHTCGITTDDDLYCWGDNLMGYLGDGTSVNRNVPTLVKGGLKWRSVSVGDTHTCGIATDGKTYCWGSGVYGELGTGRLERVAEPTPVVGGVTFQLVAAAGETQALDLEGRLYTWGGETAARTLGEKAAVPQLFSAAGRYRTIEQYGSCGITLSGELDCWKDDYRKPAFEPALRFQAISKNSYGDATRCVLTAGGLAFCWPQGLVGADGAGGAGNTKHPYPVLVNMCKADKQDSFDDSTGEVYGLILDHLPAEKLAALDSACGWDSGVKAQLSARFAACQIDDQQYAAATRKLEERTKIESELAAIPAFNITFPPGAQLSGDELKKAIELADRYALWCKQASTDLAPLVHFWK